MAIPESTTANVAEQEIWRPIRELDGLYEVSNLGNVRRAVSGGGCTFPGRPVKAKPSTAAGYLAVHLTYKSKGITRTVARLVAAAFIGPRPEGYTVNHIDGNKLNNHVSNLEYLTPSDNVKHAYETGLHSRLKGSKNPASKLTEEAVIEIRRMKTNGLTCKEIKAALGLTASTSAIALVARGATWRHVR